MAKKGLREGTKSGMKAAGESFTVGNRNSKDLKQKGINGFVSGFTSGILSTAVEPFSKSIKAKVAFGAGIGAFSSAIVGDKRKREQMGHDIGFGVGSGAVNALMGVLMDGAEAEINDIYDKVGINSLKFILGVPDFTIGCISTII